MKTLKLIAALGLGLMVSACGTVPDIASRNAPFEETAPNQTYPAAPVVRTAGQVQTSQIKVAKVGVNVPRSLKVSEANTFYPLGDIVWRGDPIGDRHAQIQAIYQNAVAKAAGDMRGATDVIVDIQVIRFHSVTEKTRFTVGGVHNMHFRMRVRDARTGAILLPSREIKANLEAFGGYRAMEAERKGQTQKVRVTDHLAKVIRQELLKVSVPQTGTELSQLAPQKN
ncbi:MAG: hypothetical protein HKN30_05350 [Sulfitobacter sp.]|nr:hypothetical protein [Sulfitobacter sp.]